jgi:hypothetical protein
MEVAQQQHGGNNNSIVATTITTQRQHYDISTVGEHRGNTMTTI